MQGAGADLDQAAPRLSPKGKGYLVLERRLSPGQGLEVGRTYPKEERAKLWRIDVELTTLEESGWEPDERARQYARDHGHNPDEIWKRFSAYWIYGGGEGKKKKDWKKTFTNWCLSESKRDKRRANGVYGDRNPSKEQVIAPVSERHQVMVGGRIYREIPELSKIRRAILAGNPIYDPDWTAFKKWQEAGNWTDVKLPPEPATPPTPEERAAEIQRLKEAGLL